MRIVQDALVPTFVLGTMDPEGGGATIIEAPHPGVMPSGVGACPALTPIAALAPDVAELPTAAAQAICDGPNSDIMPPQGVAEAKPSQQEASAKKETNPGYIGSSASAA